MDFPAYVPAAVRKHIAAMIEGDAWEKHGWAASLANAEKDLAEIQRKITARIERGDGDYLGSLRQQEAEAVKHRDMLAGNVECLKRLATHGRMQEAFALLTSEFTRDEQWRGFVYAAWAARMDYAPYRERLKRAAELNEEIADTADKLAKLIRQFSNTGVYGPGEFYSVPELLRKTDNHELQGYNLHMWRKMRRYVVGDPIRRDASEKEQTQDDGDSASAPNIVIRYLEPDEKPNIDAAEEAGNTLRYAWGVAPDFSELLDTLAAAARAFEPSEFGMIGAAIVTRQRSAKTEYLRAFGNLLTDVHHIIPTTVVMKAMANVANVVIDMPNVDVIYDDVRKALAKLRV